MMDQRLSALTSLLVGYLQSQGTSMSGDRLLFVLTDFMAIQIKNKEHIDPSAAS